jgi:hypothetical protein
MGSDRCKGGLKRVSQDSPSTPWPPLLGGDWEVGGHPQTLGKEASPLCTPYYAVLLVSFSRKRESRTQPSCIKTSCQPPGPQTLGKGLRPYGLPQTLGRSLLHLYAVGVSSANWGGYSRDHGRDESLGPSWTTWGPRLSSTKRSGPVNITDPHSQPLGHEAVALVL